MLVVTSNWYVSDGTLSAGPPRRFIDRFRAEVRKASLRGGFRCDGSYRPVDAIDIVLAGDTFDWLISREWTGDVRPWDDGRRAAAARDRVVFGAIGRSHRLLATLAAWMRRGIEVPVADRRGRPLAGPEPTANPDSQMLRLRPGHWPSHRTGEVCREVDGGRPDAHVGGLPCSLRMDDDPPPTLAAKKPTQPGGYVETKQPTYPREGRCVGRCVEDTGSLD